MSERLLTAIRESTVGEKLVAIGQIARDLLRADAEGTIRLTDDERERYLHFLPPPPPEIAAQIPTDDPAWVAEMQRRMAAPSRGLTPEQFVAELKRRVAASAGSK